MSDTNRPGYYRRFSLLYWASWHAAARVRRFFDEERESFRAGWKYREEYERRRPEPRRDPPPDPPKDRPLLTGLLACLPIIAAVIVFPHDWFLNAPALILMQVFLWWLLLRRMARLSGFVGKIAKEVMFTCLVLEAILLADYLRKHGILDWRLVGVAFGLILFGLLGFWWIGFFWILFSHKRRRQPVQVGFQPSRPVAEQASSAPELRVPAVRFADVGGMGEAKQQIREVVESRLNPEKYAAYGVVRNGVLLYGPRGSGKTFLAEATAGEFKLNFHYVSPTKLMSAWIAESERNLRGAFTRALRNRPSLLFIDEADAMGSMRQNLGTGGDPGGAGRAYNNLTIELMQSIDEARREPGFVVMAATNVIDGLDEALIRDGRFDVKVHVDLPDEATREKIFEAQLVTKPWERFDLKDFARRTPGASAAKIRSLVDQAAVYAAREGRKIEARDLELAIESSGGKDRPLFQPVEWEDVILDERVARELHTLIRLVDKPFAAQKMGLEPPMGVLLLGPPGTGKTMIARLIATQSRRSFLPITSAEITEPKAVSRVFARARENSPSLIFLDEMDGLVPANGGCLNQYYVQIVEQFLIEISNLQPEHNVFLVGTTNHPENIDPRILRGGRFSEKIEIGLPGPLDTRRLLTKYLAGVDVEHDANLDYLSRWLVEITPANLQAIVSTAKRYAFERGGGDRLLPLNLNDFERAATRVIGQTPPLPSVNTV